MLLNRRELLAAAAARAAVVRDPARWSAAWDRAVLTAAVERFGSDWDEKEVWRSGW